jgi:exopolyphosphatase/guanosine-5'-triphosphate,3'-diphosphate pyrophosphatase
MPTLAAIDVGSNAMRLVVGSVNGDRKLEVLENVREAVRLGADVFTTGTISEGAIDRAIDAFVRFRDTISIHGANWTKAIATSATREAANRDMFIDRLAQASGIELNVIGGDEEARLIHLAVGSRINLKNKLAVLLDIGGGSAEITLVADGNILSTESYRMGSVRLLQLLGEKKQGERQFNQLVHEYVEGLQKRFRKEIGKDKIDLFVGTGGNIETLGDLRREMLGREREGALTDSELDAMVKKLQNMTMEERISQLRLRPDRADVIVPAAIVLQSVLKQSGVAEVQIPRVGVKDGLFLDMVQELYGDKKVSPREQVMASAMQTGRKYSFDEQHATSVARYALELFDQTRSLHNLGLEQRLLLEVSALLHDIGNFVSLADHHKHTQYLLMANPVIGLNPSQMKIVANVARYHRKSMPKPQHEEYNALPSRDRVLVSKLAAILRLADAMDHEHGERIRTFVTEYKKPKFTIKLQGDGDLLLERWSLLKKSEMFEKVFSVKFGIEE